MASLALHNILAQIKGKLKSYVYKDHGSLVSLSNFDRRQPDGEPDAWFDDD